MRRCFLLGLLAVLTSALMSGCTTYPTRAVDTESESLGRSTVEVPESRLLDVRIEIFEPGSLPTEPELARGLSDDIRNAEAHYMPTQLRNTMHQSGHWGGVRVVPEGTVGGEVTVHGRILESDGEKLALRVEASDARGVRWFANDYQRVVDSAAYARAIQAGDEVFQSLYNEIANDLAYHLASLSPEEILAIRQVAELRFAQAFAPTVFTGYLSTGGSEDEADDDPPQDFASLFASFQPSPAQDDGAYKVVRLPASDDPMIQRVRRIRSRDYLLIDTLDQQYEALYREVGGEYTAWREARLDEINIIREVDQRANEEMATGILVTLVGVAAGVAASRSTSNTSYNNSGAAVGASIAGVAATIGARRIMLASQTREEARMSLEAMTESGESFQRSIEPYVTEVEGETVQLTGSAEAKYAQWREVMRRIQEREIGSLPTAGATLQ